MRIDVLGVGVDNLNLAEAVARASELAAGEKMAYAVTPNPEFLQMAKKNEAFKKALNGADLVVPDGIGVVKAAGLLGRPLKGRVPGIDLASGLCASLAQRGGRLFLLGAKPGVAQRAGKKLAEKYPGLVICGTHDGYFKDSAPVVEEISAARADVVFVCLGAPKQELWMVSHGPATGAKLLMGLGGSLDVFAGAVERAPEKWQKMGLEWFYRLCKEPKRIGRMAKLPLVLVDAAVCRIQGK